jgi:hypothetical protein
MRERLVLCILKEDKKEGRKEGRKDLIYLFEPRINANKRGKICGYFKYFC